MKTKNSVESKDITIKLIISGFELESACVFIFISLNEKSYKSFLLAGVIPFIYLRLK